MEFDYRLIFKIESFIILSLFFYGLSIRKQKLKHIKVMVSAIVWDILLVLQIELSRSAIKQTFNPNKNSTLLNIHISIAVTTLFLHFFMLYSGNKLRKGNLKNKSLHVKLGLLDVFLRTLNFATSLFVN